MFRISGMGGRTKRHLTGCIVLEGQGSGEVEDFGMEAKRIGLDVSKKVFELHGVNKEGEVVLRKTVRRGALQETFAQLPRCVIGLESCGTAHRWGQELASLGHEVRLMAPHTVAPYRACFETGASTAQVICEALGRESTPFTRIKAARRPVRLSLVPASERLLAGLGLVLRREKIAPARRSGS
jgi:transposase